MKVLYLPTWNRHSHDLSSDHLLTGLYAVLGYDNVVAFPEGDSMHALRTDTNKITGKTYDISDEPCETCRQCAYDSDFRHPRKNLSDDALIAAVRECNVAIIATQPGDGTMNGLYQFLRDHWPLNKPVVAVDGSDTFGGDSSFYRSLAGRPLAAFFKRELPLGDQSAIPFPLMYPASRVPKQFPPKRHRVFYHASSHGGTGPGLPRTQIERDLRRRFPHGPHGEPPFALEVQLYKDRNENIKPDEYHRRMAESLVGISWNGFPYVQQFDSNRLWENFAFGLAQVSERPRIRIPKEPVDGVHCLYVDTVDEVGPAVEQLMREPEKAAMIAQQGHTWFMQHHTAEARAAYLLNIVCLVA